MISAFRPSSIILVTTPRIETARSLSLNYGIRCVKIPLLYSTDDIVNYGIEEAKRILNITSGYVIITGSFPIDNSNTTNFMKIEEIK